MFPFTFRGRSYSSCTAAESVNGAAWCATEVDSAGAVVPNTWQDCELECPRYAETVDGDVEVNITSPVKLKGFEFLEDPGLGCTWSYHNGERQKICEPEPREYTPEYHDRDRLECACVQERDSGEGHCKSEYLGYSWCYVGEAAGCWDLTKSSSRANTHWSYGACYQALRSPGKGCFWQYENGERQKVCRFGDGCFWENYDTGEVMDLCGGAKEQQDYYDVDCEETNDYDYDLPCNTRAAFVAFAPLSASAIAVTQNYHPPHEPCKCSNFTKTIRRNGRETLLGNCNSRYRGYLWCYVDNPTNCRDFTYAKKSGKFWSFSACYLE